MTIPVSGAFPTDSAFYDASTVFTSELVQVNSRNLVGSLFIDVGNAGERGLTLDIDWGAANKRYQQVNGLSGDLDVLVGVQWFRSAYESRYVGWKRSNNAGTFLHRHGSPIQSG